MNRSPLISAAELAELTGYTKPSKQCQQLQEWGIPFKQRPDGTAALTWFEWREALSMGGSDWEPDFSTLRKAG